MTQPQPASRALRAVIYLRQSRYREESISLEAQEHACRQYAEQRGYIVVAVKSDPGISGRIWHERPEVVEATRLVRNGQADVVVLWKWSRISRNRLHWAVAADAIETAGGRIESATEPIDATTAAGRFSRDVMVSMAAFESERIGEQWREAHTRRVRLGLPHSGRPRFGYEYSRDSWYTVDPVTGPILAEAYQRYIAGTPLDHISRWLDTTPATPAATYTTHQDGIWVSSTLRRVLDSGFGAGLILYRGEHYPGAHDPVITEHEWDAYRTAREARRTNGKGERSEYLLSGLLRCHCGGRMSGNATNPPMYRCSAAHKKRAHKGGLIRAATVDDYITRWLRQYQERLDEESQKAAQRPKLIALAQTRTTELERRLGATQARLDRLTLQYLEEVIPRDSYERLRDQITVERNALETELRAAKVHDRVQPVRVIPHLFDAWDSLTVPERRAIIGSLIEYVEVVEFRPRTHDHVLRVEAR